MNHTPLHILATVDSARVVADQLLTRLSIERDVMDLGDIAHIQTTVKKIEELLGNAAQYEEILRNRLGLVEARIAKHTALDVAVTPKR
jgi:hypothetical protein